MKFTKMQGIGNDYVYVNAFEEKIDDPNAVSKFVSDRHFGIGSDGLIMICPSEVADCRMRMFNEDGSEGEMCGNGIRCVGKYAYDHGIVDSLEIDVETKAGIKHLSMTAENGKVVAVTVDMGVPELTSEIPEKILPLPESVSAIRMRSTMSRMWMVWILRRSDRILRIMSVFRIA